MAAEQQSLEIPADQMIKNIIAILVLASFTATAHAAVWLDVEVSSNSIGQDLYIVTANSDGAPITSMWIEVESEDGDLGQVHPMGFETPMADYNPFMAPPTAVDQDTQVMFPMTDIMYMVMLHGTDTAYEMEMYDITGFQPYMSLDVLQVVLQPGGSAYATIFLYVEGEGYILHPAATFGPNGSVLNLPEPGSLAVLVVGCVAMIRRR